MHTKAVVQLAGKDQGFQVGHQSHNDGQDQSHSLALSTAGTLKELYVSERLPRDSRGEMLGRRRDVHSGDREAFDRREPLKDLVEFGKGGAVVE